MRWRTAEEIIIILEYDDDATTTTTTTVTIVTWIVGVSQLAKLKQYLTQIPGYLVAMLCELCTIHANNSKPLFFSL